MSYRKKSRFGGKRLTESEKDEIAITYLRNQRKLFLTYKTLFFRNRETINTVLEERGLLGGGLEYFLSKSAIEEIGFDSSDPVMTIKKENGTDIQLYVAYNKDTDKTIVIAEQKYGKDYRAKKPFLLIEDGDTRDSLKSRFIHSEDIRRNFQSLTRDNLEETVYLYIDN